MNLNSILARFSGCSVKSGGAWAKYAAACMGGSFFLRMVYYFGLVNLRDIPGGEVFFSLILPILLAVSFVAVLKLPGLGHPVVFAVLSILIAVNYFFTASMDVGGIISGILQLGAVGLFVAACLGYLPRMDYLAVAGLAVLGVRLLFVDLFGYILPVAEFALVPYVAQCANLFSLAGLMLLFPALDRAPKESVPSAS